MKIVVLFMGLLLLFSEAKAQETYNLDSSKITYNGYHVAHDWAGVSEEAKGLLTESDGQLQRIAITVPLASFDSNSSNRDSNALRVLNAILHPEVRFYSEEISPAEDETVELFGFFELNGIRKNYRVKLRLESQEGQVNLSGDFKVNLNDFDLKLPRFLLKPVEE
ncbi:MAG: YceI family protein, partial [Bacteroidetes bacterium]|nr:YceI family protein [Bacteroidota bacterium]